MKSSIGIFFGISITTLHHVLVVHASEELLGPLWNRNLQEPFANSVCRLALANFGAGCTCTAQAIPPVADVVCDSNFCELCLGGNVDFCVQYSMTLRLVPRNPFAVDRPFVVTRSRIEERQIGQASSGHTTVLDFFYSNSEEFQRCESAVNGRQCACAMDLDPTSLNEGCFTVACSGTGIAALDNPFNFCDESTLFNLPLSHPFASHSRQSQLGFEMCLDQDAAADPSPSIPIPPKKIPSSKDSKGADSKIFTSLFDEGRGGLKRNLKAFRGA